MASRVRQSTGTKVNVSQQSVTFTVNSIVRVAHRIAYARHLPPDYMIAHREDIDRGLGVWVAEQTLRRLILEVFVEGEDHALERYDFDFEFTARGGEEARDPPVSEIENFCKQLDRLPEGATYRVVVQTAPDATPVPNWFATTTRQLVEAASMTFEAWGLGAVGTCLTYRGGSRAG
ncbi:MAG: hypothetical protein FJ288_02225 [Planctomycetes bacterium]|nr:hypothetical protein [Planctomycetota bacterium]